MRQIAPPAADGEIVREAVRILTRLHRRIGIRVMTQVVELVETRHAESGAVLEAGTRADRIVGDDLVQVEADGERALEEDAFGASRLDDGWHERAGVPEQLGAIDDLERAGAVIEEHRRAPVPASLARIGI